jgi:Uma2 family endonuclease
VSLAGENVSAGIADLLAIPENERFHEIIDGALVRKARPSARHGGAQAGLVGRLGEYNRRAGGLRPGGWRFAMETETRFGDDQIYRPDIAGWRRERLPELPDGFPMTVRPDWVCEIVSPSSESNDVIKKLRTYQRCGVPHYWVIDPIAETLVVYRWTEGGYMVVQSARGTERVRGKPFDAVSLSVHGLLEGDDE